MNNKDTLLLHASLWHQVSLMTDEQSGLIFKAVLKYALDGTEPEFNDFTLQIVWAGIKAQIDESNEKYVTRCQKNRENIRKRYEKTTNVNNGNEGIQSNTNENDGKNRIPNDMISSDMICSDMISTHQLSSLRSDNVSVCDKDNNNTHARTQEIFEIFQKKYVKFCPRLAKSDMKQPDYEGAMYMLNLCGGDHTKMWTILTQMNNKRKTTQEYTSVTQTFKAFYDRDYNK